jgi:hypothetical protein
MHFVAVRWGSQGSCMWRHAFFAAPQVGPPFTPPLVPLSLPRALPPSPQSWTTLHPRSIIVGNGSILPVTSVGDSLLPGPFYLNDVLVAPDLVQSLLSVRRLTTDNSCSMEFDPFGLSVKDLATRSVIVRYNSSSPLYTIPLSASATFITDAPPYALAATSLTMIEMD